MTTRRRRTPVGIQALLDHLTATTKYFTQRKFYVVYDPKEEQVVARTRAPERSWYTIRFRPSIREYSDAYITSIFIHEVAHVATMKRNTTRRKYGHLESKEEKTNRDHSKEFWKTYKEMVERYNRIYGLNIKVIDNPKRDNERRSK